MKNNYAAQLKSIVLSKNLPTPFTSPPTFFLLFHFEEEVEKREEDVQEWKQEINDGDA